MQITRAESWLPRQQNQVGHVKTEQYFKGKKKFKQISEIKKIANSSKL